MQSKGLSRVFSNTTVQKHQFFGTQLSTQSMEYSRPEYWSGYPFPSPGDLSNPEITAMSHALQADSLPAEPPGKPKNTGVGSLSLKEGGSTPSFSSVQFSSVQSLSQSPTLCDPMDYTVHGILQARILEWVAFPFSRGSPQPRD